ncbi:hypothetical protein CFOL_v3_09273 [Cephalotus follicularis]|uniref:Protein TILLER ANGLE CONTROL 1 n=1 Tax=Cephalotus follicularis TaxID=3775 RepID=A0A1Q3BCY8_CEPFO|nr:hypothetical protein CFOL_v3_09273 [Cephalotus follicularis]
MKIFNWVHKRFNQNVIKDGLARNVKKSESIAIDTNTKALLEQVTLVDVLDGWRDGILTIGTFGFDPLKPFNEQNGLILEREDEEEAEHYTVNSDDVSDNTNNEDEDVNLLMSTKLDHNFEGGVPLTKLGESPPYEIKSNIETLETDQGQKRKRTTLAELFYAECENKGKPISKEFDPNSGKRASLPTKTGLSFAKKLISHAGEDSSPIKKIHQLMRRMLKRKIHPELEGTAYKSNNQINPSIQELLGSKANEAGESVYLLQSPDANL